MKRKFMICGLIGILLTTVSCSNGYNNLSYSITSGTNSSNDVVNTEDQNNMQDEIMWISAVPTQFVCFGKIYYETNQIEAIEFDLMIGYLINEDEIDYWQKIDENEDVVYALDPGNGVYRINEESYLINRFELFAKSDNNYDYLAIKNITNDFVIYKK